MIEPPDLKLLDSAAKDALIVALIERVNALTATAEKAELEERRAAEAAAFRAEIAALQRMFPPSLIRFFVFFAVAQ